MTGGVAAVHAPGEECDRQSAHLQRRPVRGGRVVSGPAPQPLAGILLEHDAASDELYALGTIGAEQFEPFFAKYEFKLGFEYGPGKAKQPVGDSSVVRELTSYCRTTIQC